MTKIFFKIIIANPSRLPIVESIEGATPTNLNYKGGTITLEHTDLDWRNQCELHKGVLCWVTAEGYLNKRVIINNLPSFKPATTLNYVRKRILGQIPLLYK
jgi:hypothetical protein